MSNDKELKARIKELEEDLQFYLRRHHQLSSRSRNMKAVVEAEIKLWSVGFLLLSLYSTIFEYADFFDIEERA